MLTSDLLWSPSTARWPGALIGGCMVYVRRLLQMRIRSVGHDISVDGRFEYFVIFRVL